MWLISHRLRELVSSDRGTDTGCDGARSERKKTRLHWLMYVPTFLLRDVRTRVGYDAVLEWGIMLCVRRWLVLTCAVLLPGEIGGGNIGCRAGLQVRYRPTSVLCSVQYRPTRVLYDFWYGPTLSNVQR